MRAAADEPRRRRGDLGHPRWRERRRAGPAFYALRPGGWRDLVTLLHPPYTAWHLSYVALGAAAAPELHPARLWAALGAFFLAVGVAAHALDELEGHPLGTRLSDRDAGGPGRGRARRRGGDRHRRAVRRLRHAWRPSWSPGAFLVLAYNLELFGGRFHTDFWFAAAWGAFPALTGFWVNALGIHSFGDGGRRRLRDRSPASGLSVAQRRLSTPVRELRRRTVAVSGEQRLADGTTRELTAASLAAPLDGALAALSAALVMLAAALVAIRL